MNEIREAMEQAVKSGSSSRIREAVDKWMRGTLRDNELTDMATIETTDSQPIQNEPTVVGTSK